MKRVCWELSQLKKKFSSFLLFVKISVEYSENIQYTYVSRTLLFSGVPGIVPSPPGEN